MSRNVRRLVGYMGPVSVLALLAVGCVGVKRSGLPICWDPGYVQSKLSFAGADWWRENTRDALLWRLGFEPYWRLVERVIEHAPRADFALIVEAMPYELEEEYWGCLFLAEGERYYCYTTHLPLRLTPNGLARGLADVPYGVWGKMREPAKAATFVEALEKAGIWEHDTLCLVPTGKTGTRAMAWLIHVYCRAESKMCRMVIDAPMLNPRIIQGVVPLGTVRRDGLPAPDEGYLKKHMDLRERGTARALPGQLPHPADPQRPPAHRI